MESERLLKTREIGRSRPPLPLQDLPAPEDVFKVGRIRVKEVALRVLGPSMIALGVSIGSGEWLLGPLAVGKYGFVGIGWIILVSAVLQTFYNVEVARFTVATGEVPVVAFARLPLGVRFWMPFTLFLVYLAWIWGGWASAAGQSLFTLVTGRQNRPEELEVVRLIGIGLLVIAFGLFFFGKKISRTLEIFNMITVFVILFFLIALTLAVVPIGFWGKAFLSLIKVTPPPSGADFSLLGAIAGYTGFASGMNFMLINYYRDKGYGMGARVGFIAGLLGGHQKEVLSCGVTFPEDKGNAQLWRRWFRFLAIDQWAVFFVGAMIGMMVPCILVGYLAGLPEAGVPAQANMPTYAAVELGRLYGPALFLVVLFIGALTLFKTQSVILELMIRNTTDAAYALSAKFRRFLRGDPRRFYYPFAALLILCIGFIIHLALPTRLLVISANMANFAALVFPLAMIYLNRRLPRPASPRWWSTLMLLLNVLFFGFFFVNFIVQQIRGSALFGF